MEPIHQIGTLDSFWDALWLELWPFLCFMLESRRIVPWRAQAIEEEICYRSVPSAAPATPWLELWAVLFVCFVSVVTKDGSYVAGACDLDRI